MIRALLIPALLLVLLQTTVPGRASDRCRARVASAAESAAVEVMRELGIVVTDDVTSQLVKEIADEICNPAIGVVDSSAITVAGEVTRKFILNAEKLGRSATVKSLVAEAIGGNIGIGRVDIRSFGSLTVSCPSALRSAKVILNGRSAGTCDMRFLLRAGQNRVELMNGSSPVCAGQAEVLERSDRNCSCVPSINAKNSISCN